MRNFRLFFALVFIFSGCSTLSAFPPTTLKTISLFDVEQLRLGTSTSKELLDSFGQPKEVNTAFFENEDVWFYNSFQDGQTTMKASFTVNKRNGVIVGSVWFPDKSDGIFSETSVLSHFKNIKFKIEKTESTSPHFYVDDLEYSDDVTGVSFNVIKPSGNVPVISFSVPKGQRVPATKTNPAQL